MKIHDAGVTIVSFEIKDYGLVQRFLSLQTVTQ